MNSYRSCVYETTTGCMSSVGCAPSIINIYDSLHGRLDTHTQKIIADLIQSKQKHIEVHYHDVQWQSGPNDCGLFSIAFATSICFGNDPTKITFKQEEMRVTSFSASN